MNDALVKALKKVINNSSMNEADKQTLIDELENTAKKAKEGETEETNNAKKNSGELMNAITAYNKAIDESMSVVNKRRQESIALLKEELAQKKKDGELTQEMELAYKERIARMQVEAEAADRAGRAFKNFMNNQGFGKKLEDSFTGKMLLSGGKGFANLAEEMGKMLQPQALFASGLLQMEKATKKLFFSFDTAQTSLSKATATTGEYNDMLYDLQESNKTFGVDVEKAGKAIGDLHNELSSFNQMSSATQGMLAETTARMEVLGVKTGSGAKQFDNMIQGMGMTATMANDASMELVALGGAIGMAADTITEGFNVAASELAKYGSDAIDVFKGLASAAKATGIEMGSLMSITKQFDTFEGAAAGAGKLNAILGGGVINSMDLLNGTEEERIRLLIQSVAASGKNFESLNKFEKQAIASAAGISDMAEANKLFSMSLSAYDEMQAKGSEANEQAAMMEERAQAVQTLTEKFKMIGQSFAIAFMPVLEFMHGFANIILEINDMTGGIFIPAMVGVVGIIALLGKTTAITNAIMSVGAGITAARALIETGYGNALAFVELVQTGANLREKVSIALDLISVPAKQAKTAATISEGLAAQGATAPTVAFAASLTTLATAALPLIPAITAIGFAIGGVGLALAAPFIALAAIVTAFKELFIAMLEAPKAIGEAIVGLMAFAVTGAAAMVIMATGLATAAVILVPFAFIMAEVAVPLMMFSAALAVAGVGMYLAGAGLKVFAEGLAMFADVSPEALVMAVVSLAIFTFGLIKIMPFLAPTMLLVGVGLMLFGAGLMSFAKGLAEFNAVGFEEIGMALLSLALLAAGLYGFMMIASLPMLAVGAGLLVFGIGLNLFAAGLARFNKVGGAEIVSALASLTLLSLLSIPLAFILPITMSMLGFSLIAFALSLMVFAFALSTFNKVGAAEIASAVASLVFLSAALILVAFPLEAAALMISKPLALIGLSLGVFALGLQQFNDVGAEGILLAVGSLLLFGVAMEVLEPLMVGMIVGFTMLAYPMIMFGAGLAAIGIGLLLIGAGMSTFIGLTDVLTVISAIGLSGAAAMGVLATSIMGIALALMFIPESKSIAFGFAMEGYGAALAAVAALSPETVELSERVVAAAGEYAEIQAEMRMPDEDSFVQAMKNAFGGGDKKGDSGKNIILQLNGRELGRAVDVQLNKMHNLSID